MGNGVHARGYTLIELLVVLAIIGLVVALAAPAMLSATDRMTLGADARELTTHLRRLRVVALDRQTDISMRAGEGAILVSGGGRIELSAGTRAMVSRLTIRSDGSTAGAIDLSRGTSTYRITADRLTGRFSVERPR